MEKRLEVGDIRRHIFGCQLCEHGEASYKYFITTDLGIEYDDMALIFRKLGRCYNALNVQSKYNKVIGSPITHTVYGGPLREDEGCSGVIKITCIIPLQMKNYRLAILQEQKKILNILRSKIECRKASVSAKSGTSK